jgi:hypothetical protein
MPVRCQWTFSTLCGGTVHSDHCGDLQAITINISKDTSKTDVISRQRTATTGAIGGEMHFRMRTEGYALHRTKTFRWHPPQTGTVTVYIQ